MPLSSPALAGPLAALLAYVCWGLMPLYTRQIAQVPALEIVLHRSTWALVVVLGLLAAQRHFAWLAAALRTPRTLALFGLSALLLFGNWLLYVWAVNTGRVLEASLGYFINPLVNVLLGVAVLGERPRPLQWLAVGLAACGVAWLTWQAGQLPWVSLLLAASFGLYGLLRKTATLGALEGLALETLLLAPLAAGGLLWLAWQGQGHFLAAPLAGSWATSAWLLAAGPITAIPLLLFAYGARRVPMATLGLLQYLSPSLQFALGVLLWNEPFTTTRAIGFGLIWAALAVYSAESLRALRQARPAEATPA